jgi:hypothetical protein
MKESTVFAVNRLRIRRIVIPNKLYTIEYIDETSWKVPDSGNDVSCLLQTDAQLPA